MVNAETRVRDEPRPRLLRQALSPLSSLPGRDCMSFAKPALRASSSPLRAHAPEASRRLSKPIFIDDQRDPKETLTARPKRTTG